jgi:hypothetical protein
MEPTYFLFLRSYLDNKYKEKYGYCHQDATLVDAEYTGSVNLFWRVFRVLFGRNS